MKVAAVKKPGGPGNLIIEERVEPVPDVGEILVRIHASSLNYHDFAVIKGMIPTEDGLIPMSDGAGEVIAVGDGVTKFKVGDHVLSLFFQIGTEALSIHWDLPVYRVTVPTDLPLSSSRGLRRLLPACLRATPSRKRQRCLAQP